MLAALLAPAVLVQGANPYQLPIGSDRMVEARLNTIISTSSGKLAMLENIVEAAKGKRFVFVGETHDNADAHRWQALIIGALLESGRNVIVGLEMYQRPKQPYLDLWVMGRRSEEEFLEESDWEGQWGFDFGLYRPIFKYVQDHRLRLVALNVPRDWVRTASRGGWEALPDEAKAQLPELYMGHSDHRALFDALMAGHPPGASLDGMYTGQVLWDEAMADSALKYLEKTIVTNNTVFVVLAGNGHVMYRCGINYRIKRRTGDDGVTVVTVEIPKGGRRASVSAGLADFVIGTRGVEREELPSYISSTITSLQ